MKKTVLFLLLIGCAFAYAQQTTTPDALMLRFPDVSENEITFVYAEDIWTAPKSGGLARRISSNTGMEAFPKFSPDGKTIAFMGKYDGNNDIYTISNEGAGLQRVTYHPGTDMVIDWNPNGEDILFSSRRMSPSRRFSQFFTISSKGGNAERLPLFFIELGSFNEDGSKLAYQYLNRQFRTWKRYQGGTASNLYIYDFKEGKSTQITTYEGTDALPMWKEDRIYFLSDRGENHKLNIWSYLISDGSFRQETRFKEYDVKWPSMGPDDIVMENGGKLYLYNFDTRQLTQVEISVPSEHIQTRPSMKEMSKNINSYEISPNGKRALFDARGDIFTVPAEDGITLNLTYSSGVAEHSPHWSPDGKYIAYLSDKSGEYQIMLQKSDGSEEARPLTKNLKGYNTFLRWSPDSEKIAFRNYDGSVHYVKIESGQVTEVDRNRYGRITDFSWSPDSKWLTYSKTSDDMQGVVVLYNLDNKSVTSVTPAYYSSRSPVFDQEGKYLFYVQDRSFTPVYSPYDNTWAYANASMIMALPLEKSTPSILLQENDMEEIKEDEKTEENSDTKDKKKGKDDKEEKEDNDIKIDFDGILTRSEILPMEGGRYGGMSTAKGKLFYISAKLRGVGGGSRSGSDLMVFDLKKKESKEVIGGVRGYELSSSGDKILYSSNGDYFIIDASPGQKPGDGKVNLTDVKSVVDPKEEWNQIFYEAWRYQRDFFYDKNMHRVDWDAMKKRYEKLLPYCSSRSDLNYIIGEMIGELNVGHAYVGGGDLERSKYIGVGMLGADISSEGDHAVRIDRIIETAPWDVDERSPLKEPGVDVAEGSYIVAINHIPVESSVSPYASFQGLNGKTVILSVASDANGKDANDVQVTLLSSESALRNRAWIEQNRRYVEEKTNGRCGYIYVPNTGINGQNELFRMYQAQFAKDALIVDERWNSGGQIPDRFIELLNRPITSYFVSRDFEPFRVPFVGNSGPKVMLANEWAGSGGDAFPYYFKHSKVGPVVGKRTWGGLVGISGLPPLLDGGFLSSPNFAFFNLDGDWEVEGYGVDPDYEVDNMPEDVYKGVDNQLDKAIELINQSLENNPPVGPKIPAYPDKTGIGNE
ncbi:MAG TPA: peptidase S41 [Flavobacteriales bacterium]|jgi:tricorn protease|nr:peptidase S41 [Flavobacteriales bacterium]